MDILVLPPQDEDITKHEQRDMMTVSHCILSR